VSRLDVTVVAHAFADSSERMCAEFGCAAFGRADLPAMDMPLLTKRRPVDFCRVAASLCRCH